MEVFTKDDGLTFDAEGHRYALKGAPLMSLTQILDAAGLVDYSAVDPTVLANKAKLGTKVHEYCAWLDQGEIELEELRPYPAYYNRVLGWHQFCEDFKFTPDLNWCEVPAACKVNGITFGLTVDRFGILGPVDGSEGLKTAVVELKTCANAEPSHQVQTAGQVLLFKGDGQTPIKRFAVYLLAQPNGSGKCYKVVEHSDRLDEKIFLCALTLTQFRVNNGLLKGN